MYSQLEFVESQTKVRQNEGENSLRSDSAVINEMWVLLNAFLFAVFFFYFNPFHPKGFPIDE